MLQAISKHPGFKLVCEKSHFSNEKSKHDRHLKDHHFVYKVEVFIPECQLLPEPIAALCKEVNPYLRVRGVPAAAFLRQDFIQQFVSQGAIYALSYNTRIDQDNTLALLPTGTLILNVTKDTYEELGLQGQPSQYTGRKPLRYVIKLQLTEPSMAPGRKCYERAVWALSEKVPLRFDVLVSWQPPEGKAAKAPAKFFAEWDCREVRADVTVRPVAARACPALDSLSLQPEDGAACGAQDFFDWLGAVSCDIDCSSDSSASMRCPEPSLPMGPSLLCSITGLIRPDTVIRLLSALRRYFDEPKLACWATLTAHGFADSPVSWASVEHGFHKGGENLQTLLAFANGNYWLLRAVGTNDGCPS